ncbi:MAG: serine/threonine-protein kinase [Sandaracinus sp.]
MKKPIPFGKYLLLERVNVGGMAEVFKAKAYGVEGFERLVAVKRILPSIAEDQEFITMFIDEAKISVQLTHANIAQIFDLGKVGDSYFIAMEYVHGKDLRAIFDRARKRGETVPVPMACYLAMKVCEGLDYAHNKKDASGRELNLVHRDVSPQNILLSYDGESKLIDFGIAKAAGKAGKTQAGILKGKFGYMSPEQVRGLPLDRRSDIFAVGIVLYELLTGERLFVGESDFSTLEKVKNVEIMPPSTYNRRIPEELEQIVLKGLAKDVDDRYQTAMDLHDDLQSFMYTSGNFFSRKDLGAYMRKAFAEEIAKESAREEEYRRMEAEAANLGAGLEQFDDIEGDPPAAAANVSPQRAPAPAPKGAPPPKQKSTMLGMPAVSAGVPPPPPRMSGGPPPPPPRMSAAAPPPPPAPAPAAPPPAAAKSGASLDMDWDEEELSTQIYDKPEGNLIAEVPTAAPVAPAPAPALARPSLGLGVAAPAPAGQPSPFSSPSMSSPGMPSPVAPRPTPMPIATAAPAPAPMGAPSPFDAPAPGPATDREPTAVTRQKEPARGGSSMAILAGAAIILLVLLAAGGYALFGRSSPATIHLTTTPSDAVVYVDDQPITTSTSSPFTVPNIEPGSHIVEVRKHGFRTWATPVVLSSGQELTLPTVTLEPEAPAAVAGVPAPPQGTGFSLDTVPTGARVFVNGVELPQHTPVTVTDLQAGTYQIRVDLGANYTPSVSQISIPAGQVIALPAAVLTLRAVTVAFSSTPSGAEVTLVRGAERRSIGETPVSADVDITGGAWTVEMERAGYRDYSAELALPPNQATAGHDAVLEEIPRGTAVGVVRPPPPPTTTTRPVLSTSVGRTTPPPTTTAPAHTDEGSGGGGNGTLRINTRPWSQVFVDGRLIGNTPQMNIPLPAGRHTVTLVNSEFNIRETITVTIQAGQTTTQSLTLTPG